MLIGPCIQLCLKTHTCWHVHTHILKFFCCFFSSNNAHSLYGNICPPVSLPRHPQGEWNDLCTDGWGEKRERKRMVKLWHVCKNPQFNFDIPLKGEGRTGHTPPPTPFENSGSKVLKSERPPTRFTKALNHTRQNLLFQQYFPKCERAK